MGKITELPDDDELSFPPMHSIELPPYLADSKPQTVDEVVADLKKTPFFMTSLDDAGDEDNPELDAIRALLYEGTRAEVAENFREQGNEFAKEKKWKDGKEVYTKGLVALRQKVNEGEKEEPERERKVKEALLANRALCHLELRTVYYPLAHFSKKDRTGEVMLIAITRKL